MDLELWNLICFFYRPALITRLIRQTPAAYFPGRAAMYTPAEGHVKATNKKSRVSERHLTPVPEGV